MCPTPSSRATPSSPSGSAPQSWSASCAVQPWTNTLAPCSCSRRTIAKPMPTRLLTPVTSAFIPDLSTEPDPNPGARPGPGTVTKVTPSLRGEDGDDFAHGGRRRLERLPLVVGQVELDDLLNATGAELHGHPHVEAVDAVLAFEIRGARENALLVQHDRVDHLRGRRTRCVPGRGAHEVDELASACRGALHHRLNLVLGDELTERHTADRRRRDDRHHL